MRFTQIAIIFAGFLFCANVQASKKHKDFENDLKYVAEHLGLDRTLKDLTKDLPDLSRGLTLGRH
ncbi:hypothetical protein VTP01DRAFT_7661 [Rhizomucor pusillus]|uniref:uncharacterized protein n=1 Tax=Rhizomucor pusillus TaxID=4840 RepID=UPI0037447AB3